MDKLGTLLSSGVDNQVASTYFMKNKLWGRPPQYAPAPASLTFNLESGVQVTCDVGYRR